MTVWLTKLLPPFERNYLQQFGIFFDDEKNFFITKNGNPEQKRWPSSADHKSTQFSFPFTATTEIITKVYDFAEFCLQSPLEKTLFGDFPACFCGPLKCRKKVLVELFCFFSQSPSSFLFFSPFFLFLSGSPLHFFNFDET